jgi:peptide chain release factor 2
LKEIEKLIAKDGFWDKPENSTVLLKERTLLSGKVDSFKQLTGDLEETEVLLDLGEEESDIGTLEEVAQQLPILDRKISKLSLDLMLDGENDKNNAIVSINAGAGGTEAQDWAEMLFRMYGRWVERRGFKTKLIDLQPGDEAGIKGATFTASGDYAYGYLKAETGVHRLVRISPFNAGGKRHTSFASVFVYPELDKEIVKTIKICESILIGPGGPAGSM